MAIQQCEESSEQSVWRLIGGNNAFICSLRQSKPGCRFFVNHASGTPLIKDGGV